MHSSRAPLYSFVKRLTSFEVPRPAQNRALSIALAAIGGGLGILLMLVLAESAHFAWGLVPFATSIVLVLGSPDAPQAQPRNIVGGHLLSALSGAVCCSVLGHGIPAAALGVAGAIALMQATRTFHPPAGINPVVMVIAGAGWSFVLMPVGLGAGILVAYAWIYHRLTQDQPWPKSWM
jgi:CBS-domain-containing membrane protein